MKLQTVLVPALAIAASLALAADVTTRSYPEILRSDMANESRLLNKLNENRVAIAADVAALDAEGAAALASGSISNVHIRAAAAIDATKIGAGGVTSTEFGYIGTLSSDAQVQLTGLGTSKVTTNANLTAWAAIAPATKLTAPAGRTYAFDMGTCTNGEVVAFGRTYGAAPNVFISPAATNDAWRANSVTTTNFTAAGFTSPSTQKWVSVGYIP